MHLLKICPTIETNKGRKEICTNTVNKESIFNTNFRDLFIQICSAMYIYIYSWLSLSRPRLSRITAYLEVKIWSLPKHENLTTGKKYCGKEEKLLLRSNFSSFPQYFQYTSNFKNLILHIYLLNMVNRIIFPSILQMGYVEVRISRRISESPLKFKITRVDLCF